ncbi:MAG: zf-HC2 domain-containing protein [Planctomycetota bacterium]|jgi:tetratricopeptide (TPR) repeat protein
MNDDHRHHHDSYRSPDGGEESLTLEGLDACTELQFRLSLLIDGELSEESAARAIAEIESCPACRDFFDAIRGQVRLNRELHDASALRDHYADLIGAPALFDMEARQAVHRLAEIFYQLGKAYALSAIDPDYRTRVFEQAVAVESTRVRGRGYVDGVAGRSGGEYGGFDWRAKRHLLNGTLEKIEDPLTKARRLLEEALEIEPDHEPSQLYLGFLDARDGRRMAAAKRFEQVFQNAVEEGHRGHAASQLGVLFAEEGSYDQALKYFRWIGMSGLAGFDPRFFVAQFSVGVCYAHLRRRTQALATFRRMLDTHPDRVEELAGFFARSPELQQVIDSQPGFTEELARTCPELFGSEETGQEIES